MITNKQISELIISTLENSADLETYAQDNFSKSALIFLGIDTDNPPHTTDYPLLAISPLVNEMSDENTNYDYEIVVHLMIKGDEEPIINGNVIRYNGIYKVEEFGNIVVNELKKSFCSTNLDAYDITFYIHEIEIFPVYTGAVVIHFSLPNTIGDIKLELGA